eukprot:COSAG06_NODE_764_length_12486_cov_190.016630_5_plen_98_part_00
MARRDALQRDGRLLAADDGLDGEVEGCAPARFHPVCMPLPQQLLRLRHLALCSGRQLSRHGNDAAEAAGSSSGCCAAGSPAAPSASSPISIANRHGG